MARQGTRLRDYFGHPVSIKAEHYRIHEGESFIAGYGWLESVSTATPLADNQTVALLIKPGSAMHIISNIAAAGDFDIYFYKGATTGTSAGTQLTIFNNNEYSNKTSQASLYYGSTGMFASLGTAYPGVFLPGGTGGNAVGGDKPTFNRERIIRSTDIYAITLTNRSGGISPVSAVLEWYEPGASS